MQDKTKLILVVALVLSCILNVALIGYVSLKLGLGETNAPIRADSVDLNSTDIAATELESGELDDLLMEAERRGYENGLQDAESSAFASRDELIDVSIADDVEDPWAKYRVFGILVEFDEFDNRTSIISAVYLDDTPSEFTAFASFEGTSWDVSERSLGIQFSLRDYDASVRGDDLVFLVGSQRHVYKGDWSNGSLYAYVPLADLKQILESGSPVRAGWWTHKGEIAAGSIADLKVFVDACESSDFNQAKRIADQ